MKKILLFVLSFLFLVPLASAKTVDLNDIDYEAVNGKISSFINESYDFIEKEIIRGVSCNEQKKDFAPQPD